MPEHNEFFFYIQIATLGIAIVNSDSDTGFPTVKRVSEAASAFETVLCISIILLSRAPYS